MIKWKNYNNPEDNTWEPINNLDGYKDLIKLFEESSIQFKKNFDKDDDATKVTNETKKGSKKNAKNVESVNIEAKKKAKKEKKCAQEIEETYNIESLIKKKGSKYLVKWENYSDDVNTWEPIASIPHFILKVIFNNN